MVGTGLQQVFNPDLSGQLQSQKMQRVSQVLKNKQTQDRKKNKSCQKRENSGTRTNKR